MNGRRRWMLGGLVTLVSGWLARSAVADEGEVVKTRMRRGNPPAQPLGRCEPPRRPTPRG